MSTYYKAPAQLDIVYGWFPYSTAPTAPGADSHYCLVLDVYEQAPGEPWVIVAMGTSQKVTSLHAGEFAVTSIDGSNAFVKTGLAKHTKFSFQRTKLALLPYNDQWFSVPPEKRPSGKTPKIGVLDEATFMRKMAAASAVVNLPASLFELANGTVGALAP